MMSARLFRLLSSGAMGVLLLCTAQGAAAQQRDTTSYLHPGDALELRVWPDSALGGKFLIEKSGEVFLPFVGRIPVAFRDLDSLRAELRQRYTALMQNPVVTLIPEYRIGIFGGVARPGLYRVDPTTTVLDAVSMAGGFRNDAKPADMRIVRSGRTFRVNGKEVLAGDVTQDVALRSGDRIVVPRSVFGLRYLPMFLQSAILALTLYNIIRR